MLHGLWTVSSPGQAFQLLTICPCLTDGLFALLGGPHLLSLLPLRPCGLGRWRGGLHSLFSPDPENNPLYSCASPYALTSSSHSPQLQGNLIPIRLLRTLRPGKGMGPPKVMKPDGDARWGAASQLPPLDFIRQQMVPRFDLKENTSPEHFRPP